MGQGGERTPPHRVGVGFPGHTCRAGWVTLQLHPPQMDLQRHGCPCAVPGKQVVCVVACIVERHGPRAVAPLGQQGHHVTTEDVTAGNRRLAAERACGPGRQSANNPLPRVSQLAGCPMDAPDTIGFSGPIAGDENPVPTGFLYAFSPKGHQSRLDGKQPGQRTTVRAIVRARCV